jgi:hypothetical protein
VYVLHSPVATLNECGPAIAPRPELQIGDQEQYSQLPFLARLAIYNFVPLPGVCYGVAAYNYFRGLHDPTGANIPVVPSSHERAMFDDIHRFRSDNFKSEPFVR